MDGLNPNPPQETDEPTVAPPEAYDKRHQAATVLASLLSGVRELDLPSFNRLVGKMVEVLEGTYRDPDEEPRRRF